MKTPNGLMETVNTRGDYRRLSESAHEGVERKTEYPELPAEHPLWEVWQVLSEIFSNFVPLYGEQPNWGWFGTLGDLSAADLGVGIQGIRDRPKTEFPPNATEFFQLCRPETPAQRRNRLGSERNPDAKALPNPNAILNPEQAQPYLQKMRAMLTEGTTL